MSCAQEKIYSYTVRAASPARYDMTFDFSCNYLLGPDGKPMLHFALPGGGDDSDFGGGSQATLLSERNPLPTGIHLRWFSASENQFWEAEHLFDASVLNALMDYKVANVIDKKDRNFDHYFTFVVNVVPRGKAYVWINGAGLQVLIAEIQAKKVDEPDWDAFRNRSTFFKKENREEFIEKIYSMSPEKEIARQEIANGTYPWHGETWARLTQKFPWKLMGNENFTMQDYLAWYMNGEQYFTYTDPKKGFIQDLSLQPVPYRFSFFMKDNTPEAKLYRINLYLKKDHLLEQFEAMNKAKPANASFELQIVVKPDFKEIFVYLVKGDHRVELEIERSALQDLYYL